MQDPSSEQRGVAIHDPAADMRGPEAQDDGMRSDSVAAREATAPCGPMSAPEMRACRQLARMLPGEREASLAGFAGSCSLRDFCCASAQGRPMLG